jgi:hypothetical protein
MQQNTGPQFVPSNRKPRFSPKNFAPCNTIPKYPQIANNGTNQGGFGTKQGGSQFPNQQGTRTPCQIYGKINHIVLDMDYAYQDKHSPTQLATMVAYTNADLETQDWLANSGANAHITADPTTINNPHPFEGTETVGVWNGTCLNIKASGFSLVHSNLNNCSSKFFLKDILYCPSASANLLSINKLCINNHCIFELTRSCFTVKDTLTRTVLLQGHVRMVYIPFLYIAFLKIN